LHGEQIGVAAVEMASIQDSLLVRDRPPTFLQSTITRDDVLAHFGPALGDACWRELAPKLVDPARAVELDARVASRWPEIRARIAAISVTPERIAGVLAAAGAPTTPMQLGYSDDLWGAAVIHAREIRDRYTFLDLMADST
jgi:glycerol-1-phosphate dehydrogenase [NAD(P)+]